MSEEPALKVVRGNPSDAEVAALVLALRQVSAKRESAARRSRWVEDARTYPVWDPRPWA